jgi:hypothetical protein
MKCAADDGHNIASMGGFVLLPPVAIFSALSNGTELNQKVIERSIKNVVAQ